MNQFAKAFDPYGTNYRDAESIQDLIYDCVRNGKIDPNDQVVYYYKVDSYHAIKTVIGSNGYICTAHPIKIKNMPIQL